MKTILIIFTIISLTLSSNPPRILQILRVLSPECNNNGYLYKNQCFCKPGYTGAKCELSGNAGGYYDDATTKCDDILSRLDYLTNISPENYDGDDSEFTRFELSTIGNGKAAYGEKGSTWIKMHDVSPNFQIFGGTFNPTDIHQGSLGNCYLLASLAALSIHKNGSYIKDVFLTKEDNPNHVYVTRWMIAGKPRFVAVDDWVPGSGNKPSFSRATSDNDFWSMILEKAWAKIYGNYMVTEAGWHTNVWKAMTQAPIYTVYFQLGNKTQTKEDIFNNITEKLQKGFPVGTGTPKGTQEVEGHAYAIVGTYDLNLKSGENLKLIKLYNPWNSDTNETANPWKDNSTLWTPEIISLVGHKPSDDGLFYVTPEYLLKNWMAINWAEVNPSYDVNYIDVPLNKSIVGDQKISTKFKVNNPTKQKLYVFIDIPDSRLFKENTECTSSFPFFTSPTITDSKKKTYKASPGTDNVIEITESGDYEYSSFIFDPKPFIKYVTITAYAPSNTISFTQNYGVVTGKDCLNKCSGKGKCNYYNGYCTCFRGWGGLDCSKKAALSCPNNCGGETNGTCNTSNGECSCKSGFIPPICTPCKDKSTGCKDIKEAWCSKTHVNHEYMKEWCQSYCGNLGYEGFGNCIVPKK